MTGKESTIVEELNGAQGNAVDLQGYFHTNSEVVEKVMRPSTTLNSIIDNL